MKHCSGASQASKPASMQHIKEIPTLPCLSSLFEVTLVTRLHIIAIAMSGMPRRSPRFDDGLYYNETDSRIDNEDPVLILNHELPTSSIDRFLTGSKTNDPQFRKIRNIFDLCVRHVRVVQSRQPLRTSLVCPIQDILKIFTNMIRAIAIRSFFRAIRTLPF